MAYAGEKLDVAATSVALMTAAREAGFAFDEILAGPPAPMLVLWREAEKPDAPRFYLSGGIHGDEPAGPLAIIELMRQDRLPRDCGLVIFPMICPENLLDNSRENRAGVDPNRDYNHLRSDEVKAQVAWLEAKGGSFTAAFCLHEDWEFDGFYLYEVAYHPRGVRVADAILRAVENITGIESRGEIEGRPATDGLISISNLETRSDWPEALYLFSHHTRLVYTLETPSSLPLAGRVEAHVEAVSAAIESCLRQLAG